MKKTITACLMAMLPMAMSAQTTEETASKHLDFLGVSIEGNIDDFTKRMQPKFKLKKRVGGENYYIFEGPMFGYDVYAQVNYTRKSRTVYRVMVTPQNINTIAWQDSLVARYGQPLETPQGQLFQMPGGKILYYTPQGYDSAMIYLDSAGNGVFVEEKK